MARSEIHLGDIGTVFKTTVKDGDTAVDLSAASVKNFLFRKPDDSVITRAATFVGNGSDGRLQYATVAGDLDQTGQWKSQIYIETPSGKWHSDIGCFIVHDNLD